MPVALAVALVLEAGQSAPWAFTVRNDGPDPVTYQFVVVQAPAGLDVVLDGGQFTRTVAPGTEDVLAGAVVVAPGLAVGDYAVVIELQ